MPELGDSSKLSPDSPFPSAKADTRRHPLLNLSSVQFRMDSLHKFLSESVNNNCLIGKTQMDMVSGEISSAIHQIIVNGAALLSCAQTSLDPPLTAAAKSAENISDPSDLNIPAEFSPKLEEKNESDADSDVIEVDAVELLAEHVHLCEICGNGFKRDANLRMHMRAHGNQFKTPESLSKPEKLKESPTKNRFSCPFEGCNRNKKHKKFRALKSVICVKNHFKRSHCPKMYSCNRCNKKSFSVMADLKSHLKHCGESKWKCRCGTSFSRKDKLFGHMALFEGHMPAISGEEEEEEEEVNKGKIGIEREDLRGNCGGDFEGLLDGYSMQDVWGPPDNFWGS